MHRIGPEGVSEPCDRPIPQRDTMEIVDERVGGGERRLRRLVAHPQADRSQIVDDQPLPTQLLLRVAVDESKHLGLFGEGPERRHRLVDRVVARAVEDLDHRQAIELRVEAFRDDVPPELASFGPPPEIGDRTVEAGEEILRGRGGWTVNRIGDVFCGAKVCNHGEPSYKHAPCHPKPRNSSGPGRPVCTGCAAPTAWTPESCTTRVAPTCAEPASNLVDSGVGSLL